MLLSSSAAAATEDTDAVVFVWQSFDGRRRSLRACACGV